MKKKWYNYLWMFSSLYLILGFFNILFAWMGLICFFTPLLISIIKGKKSYCHYFCGRGQLFELLGEKLHLSRNKPTPKWMYSKWFRYGFLIFFLTMFGNMLFRTYLVIEGKPLTEVVKLFWTFKVPFSFANHGGPSWALQFSYGFYSLMLTSTLIGFILMILYKPRSWCTFCPMGTMTQGICKLKK